MKMIEEKGAKQKALDYLIQLANRVEINESLVIENVIDKFI